MKHGYYSDHGLFLELAYIVALETIYKSIIIYVIRATCETNAAHPWCYGYFASQVRDPRIDSHRHLKDSCHIWIHLRRDVVFRCILRCRLISLHGYSRPYRVAILRAESVGRTLYNLYFVNICDLSFHE